MMRKDTTNFYQELDLKYPEMGIVLEDTFWNYGDKKEKAKIGIPVLLPMESRNSVSINKYKSNYIEAYIPDAYYTYPTNETLVNKDPEIRGQREDKLNGKKGTTITGLTRMIPKGTKVIIVFIGGNISEPKVIGKYDDQEQDEIDNIRDFSGGGKDEPIR